MHHAVVTRVVAVRHGETAWNVDNRIQGQLDVPLNVHGHWQARRAALALRDEGLEVIYSSDLVRAHATALSIGHATGLPVSIDRGLRERSFGVFEGRTWAEIELESPEGSARWRARDSQFAPDGGETLEIFHARVVETAERLVQRHPGQTVALVAHGGVLDCLHRAAARVGLDAVRTWQLGNAAINRLLYTSEGFAIVGWSDTAHLEGPLFGEPLEEFSDGQATLLNMADMPTRAM